MEREPSETATISDDSTDLGNLMSDSDENTEDEGLGGIDLNERCRRWFNQGEPNDRSLNGPVITLSNELSPSQNLVNNTQSENNTNRMSSNMLSFFLNETRPGQESRVNNEQNNNSRIKRERSEIGANSATSSRSMPNQHSSQFHHHHHHHHHHPNEHQRHLHPQTSSQSQCVLNPNRPTFSNPEPNNNTNFSLRGILPSTSNNISTQINVIFFSFP